MATATIPPIDGYARDALRRAGNGPARRTRRMGTGGGGGELSRSWSVVAIAAAVLVALLGLPGVAALPTASAVLAVAAATAGAFCWPRRPGLISSGAVGAGAVSLADTVLYRSRAGDPLTGWVLVETAFMLS